VLGEAGFIYAVVDTPPAITDAIRAVVALADFVLIPVKPSPHDLRAVGRTVEIAREGGVRLQFCRGSRSRRLHLVPPYVPHQEINADPSQTPECVLVRSNNEAVVVNIMDVEPVEKPEEVYWVDPIHRRP
jgi:hypothetical protein